MLTRDISSEKYSVGKNFKFRVKDQKFRFLYTSKPSEFNRVNSFKFLDEIFEEFSTTGIAGSLQGTLKIIDDSISSEMREEPEGESPYDPAESESDLFLPRIDWDTLETSLKTRCDMIKNLNLWSK